MSDVHIAIHALHVGRQKPQVRSSRSEHGALTEHKKLFEPKSHSLNQNQNPVEISIRSPTSIICDAIIYIWR